STLPPRTPTAGHVAGPAQPSWRRRNAGTSNVELRSKSGSTGPASTLSAGRIASGSLASTLAAGAAGAAAGPDELDGAIASPPPLAAIGRSRSGRRAIDIRAAGTGIGAA